jgi:hypothetical protein
MTEAAFSQLAEQLLSSCIGLVQQAEKLSPALVDATAQLAYSLGCNLPTESQASLAFVIERVCDELISNRVHPGAALPALCTAADTLLQSVGGVLTSAVNAGLAASHFELDTLLPIVRASGENDSRTTQAPTLIAVTALQRSSRQPIDPMFTMRQRRTSRGASPPARVVYDL